MQFNTYQEAATAWAAHKPIFEAHGIFLPDVKSYTWGGIGRDYTLAMDAQPALGGDPNSAIPTMLTTMIDPTIYEFLFAALKAAKIFGEARKGTWTDQTIMLPSTEIAGEVSNYGDFNNNGKATVNMNWPQRQATLFQIIAEYGELEIARAGLGRINWVGEVDKSALTKLAQYLNQTYFFGSLGLQNYGLLNDPNLSAALTPGAKAYGGVKWINNGQIVASANEVYADIQALYLQLVNQSDGLIEQDTKMVLALSPPSSVALTATNSFNVNVTDLLKKNFPSIRVETAVQYGVSSAQNNQTNPAGASEVQLIAEEIEGQQAGYCAYNEKARAHTIVRELSAWKKKMTSGSWGCIIRQPLNIASMVGI